MYTTRGPTKATQSYYRITLENAAGELERYTAKPEEVSRKVADIAYETIFADGDIIRITFVP